MDAEVAVFAVRFFAVSEIVIIGILIAGVIQLYRIANAFERWIGMMEPMEEAISMVDDNWGWG